MKTRTIYFLLSFMLFSFNIFSQKSSEDQDETKDCASIVNIDQDCQQDKTVDISFQILNSTNFDVSMVSIKPDNGSSQDYTTQIPAGQTSLMVFTFDGATPGTELCFEIILHSGSEGDYRCCHFTVCIQVDCCSIPGCCDLSAAVGSVSCEGTAIVVVSGGTMPYSGPGSQIAPGVFRITGLVPGLHNITYTDPQGCMATVQVNIPLNDLQATVHHLGCGNQGDYTNIFVSGGTYPYTGPGIEIAAAGNFIVQGLGSGTHTLVYVDANGCEVEVTFTIPPVVNANLIGWSGCPASGNATANIFVSGGVYPYTGPGIEIAAAGNFIVQNLGVGTHTFLYTDANGCTDEVSLTIPDIYSDCDGFTFTRTQADNVSNNLYQETFFSEISATVSVSLDAILVPDRLIVTVNGTTVLNFSAGSSSCDGSSGSTESGEFEVEPCDEIEFEVQGDICPLGNTRWTLDVSCEESDDGGGSRVYSTNEINALSEDKVQSDRFHEELSLNPQLVTKINSNPAHNRIDVISLIHDIRFQKVRIFDLSGNQVYSENLANQDQIQLNVSRMIHGVYAIELTDTQGYKFYDKIMWLE